MNLEEISDKYELDYDKLFQLYNYQSSKVLKRDWPKMDSFIHVPQLSIDIIERYQRMRKNNALVLEDMVKTSDHCIEDKLFTLFDLMRTEPSTKLYDLMNKTFDTYKVTDRFGHAGAMMTNMYDNIIIAYETGRKEKKLAVVSGR